MLAAVDAAAVHAAAPDKEPHPEPWAPLPGSHPALLTRGMSLEPTSTLEQLITNLTLQDDVATDGGFSRGLHGLGEVNSPTHLSSPPLEPRAPAHNLSMEHSTASTDSPALSPLEGPSLQAHQPPTSLELPPALTALLQQAQAQAAERDQEQRRRSMAGVLLQAQAQQAQLVHKQQLASLPVPVAGKPPRTSGSPPGSLLGSGILTPSQSFCDFAAPGSLSNGGSVSQAGSAQLLADLPNLSAYLQPQQAPQEQPKAASTWLPSQGSGFASANMQLYQPAGAQAASPFAAQEGCPSAMLAAGLQLGGLPGALSFAGANGQGPPAWQTNNSWLSAGMPGSLLQQQQQQLAAATWPQILLASQLPAHLQAILLQQQCINSLSQPAMSIGRETRARPQSLEAMQAAAARRQALAAAQEPPETLMGLAGRYQPYCQQIITPRLNEAAASALEAVKKLQAEDSPAVTALTGKRYFCSLKEVSKVTHAARMLIISPDIQPSFTANINPVRALQRILADAQAAGVPVVFALSRRGIGQVFGRDKSMSVVALMHVQGVEAQYSVLLEEALKGRQLYMQHRATASQPKFWH